jgi:glycosyltransferase involved in cell wall biosynthesis
MQPLVSILIPAFNAESWIAETIESALAQSWEPKEIIVIDDGSTDRTAAIARQFTSKVMTVVTQPNQGAAAARNKAFSLSQGEYIQWLDADDLLAPDKIAKQMEVLRHCENQRTLASSAWGHFIYRPSKATFTPTSLWCDLAPLEWLLRMLEQGVFMQTATWLVSRELTEAAGSWHTQLLGDDDGEYFCRVILASNGIKFVESAKVFYRRVASNRLSHIALSDTKIRANLLSIQLHVDHIRAAEDSARVRAACLKYLERDLLYFYPEKPEMWKMAEQLAHELGGHLKTPQLPWKYAWIRRIFGWTAAKRAQLVYNQVKLSILRSWDAALCRLEM